ncbi:unnamed protein product [Paramecium octaurelia]|uniref:Uncharacterized protein n=1 Tax=Paramecium octaurelia TaxID=43137 RepID=A0A8S1XCF4_PAROT|nr:unnamed protein product [Paramecium octaurelia]
MAKLVHLFNLLKGQLVNPTSKMLEWWVSTLELMVLTQLRFTLPLLIN